MSDASKRGWRAEGFGANREEILPMSEIQTSFLCPFSYATLRRRGTQFWGSIFAVFWHPFVANPLLPTPFSKPLNVVDIFQFATLLLGKQTPMRIPPSLRHLSMPNPQTNL